MSVGHQGGFGLQDCSLEVLTENAEKMIHR